MSFIYDLSATWNNVATVFTGIGLNASNGGSGTPVYAAGSTLINLKNNGTSVFSVDPLGNVSSSAGFLNQPIAVNTSSTLSSSTNGQKVVLGGTNFSTLTLAAVGNYPAGFSVMIFNVDSFTGKIIAPNGGTNFRLWPGQYTIAYILNGVWRFTPLTAWNPGTNFTVYLSPTGANTNDGLSALRPLKDLTFNGGLVTTWIQEWDVAFYNVTAQLADGTYTDQLHLPGQLPGQHNDAGFLIQGNQSSPSSVIIDPSLSGAAIAAFNCGWVQIKNMTLKSTVGAGGLTAKSGSKIETLGGIIFGSTGAGSQQQAATQGGLILHNGDYRVSAATIGYGVYVSDCSKFIAQNMTINYDGDVTYVGSNVFTINSASSYFSNVTINTNAHTILGTRYQVDGVSSINTNGGGANYLPGSVAGSASNGGVYY